MSFPKRYAQVGTGGRGLCFLNAMVKDWKRDCELVALCDSNPGHMDYYNRRIVNEELGGEAVRVAQNDGQTPSSRGEMCLRISKET